MITVTRLKKNKNKKAVLQDSGVTDVKTGDKTEP